VQPSRPPTPKQAAAAREAAKPKTTSCKNRDVAATSPTKVGSPSAFTISRRAEFASKPELTKQIGHPPEDWPVAAVKELVDNALDDCERAGVAPVVAITLDEEKETLTVEDNGRGIAPDTVTQLRDYDFRTSTNVFRSSPSRGQQGAGLQSTLAMSHALTGEPSVTIIEARGFRHRITFTVDPISREPILDHQTFDIPAAAGTKVTMVWRGSAALLRRARGALHNAAIDFAAVNPHATVHFSTRGAEASAFYREATNPGWKKWTPEFEVSAHWHDAETLKDLIAAEIDKARKTGAAQRTVADFIADFRGLSGTAKRRDICEASGATRQTLEALFARGDHAIGRLLGEMKTASRPGKPIDLGVIGERHLFTLIGGAPATRRYKLTPVDLDGVPYLVECAFSVLPNAGRLMITGLNWSISVNGNPFQRIGDYGEGLEAVLEDQRAGPEEPVGFFLHVASPRLRFIDKGKSDVDLPRQVDEAIVAAVKFVTAAWAKQRKSEERNANAALRRMDVLTASAKPMSIKGAAYAVMRQAYAKASAGRDDRVLWVDARQIYYAARPEIMRLAQVDTVNSGRFTQEFLINFMNDHPGECANWKVAFSDRGDLVEPHTGLVVGLGTLAVQDYVDSYAKPKLNEAGYLGPEVSTRGPEGRCGGLLYIEKRGFRELLDQAQIAERFDLTVMSCKGMSVAAARKVIDRTCARFKIPLYTLHDFDVSGFSIAATLHRSNRRYQFATTSGADFKVFDFGLRLEDVERLGLASEPVSFGKVSKDAWRERLKINGATDREIEFLLTGPRLDIGQRVELNAMTSLQFLDFLEAKLAEHRVSKVIPSARQLADVYRLFERGERARRIVDAALATMSEEEIAAPADLVERVRAYLAEHPEAPWEEAVAELVRRRAKP